MVIRKKSKEELVNQAKGFFDHSELSDITDDNKRKILDTFKDESLDITNKDELRSKFDGILSGNDFDLLYGKYVDYNRDEILKIRNFLIKINIFPERYKFLANDLAVLLVRDGTSFDMLNEELPEELSESQKLFKNNIDFIKEKIGIDDRNLGKFIGFIVDSKIDYEAVEKNINVFKSVGIKSAIDLARLCTVFCYDDGSDVIELLVKSGMKNTDDFLKLENLVSSRYYNNLKLFLDSGIKSADDLLKLSDYITLPRDENSEIIEAFKDMGVNTADDFLKLKPFIFSPYFSGNIKFFTDIMSSILVGELEYYHDEESNPSDSEKVITIHDLVDILFKLKDLILHQRFSENQKSNILTLFKSGINKPDDLMRLKEIIYYGNNEKIELFIGAGIKSVDGLLKLKNLIYKYYYSFENIKLFIDIGIKDADELSSLESFYTDGNIDNVKILIAAGVRTADDFLKLSDIIYYGNKEILLILKDIGIKDADDFLKLKDIIGKKEYSVNLEILKDAKGVKTADDILQLTYIIKKGYPKILRLFVDAGMSKTDQFLKIEDFVDYGHIENVEKNIKALKEFGILNIDDLLDLKDCIFSNHIAVSRKLEILRLANITSPKDVIKLSGYLSGKDFNNFLYEFDKISEISEINFDDSLFKLSAYVKEIRDSFGSGFDYELQRNLLYMYYIKGYSIEDLRSFEVLLQSKPEVLMYVYDKYKDISLFDLERIRYILKFSSLDCLKLIFGYYKNITIDELLDLEDISKVNSSNLKIIFEKFPNLPYDELLSLSDFLECVNNDNLKIIFEKFPKITIEELNKLKDILSSVIYTKIFKLVFDSYENITIDELNSLTEVLKVVRMSNRKIIHNNYQNLEINNLIDLGDILSENTEPDSLLFVLKKFPNISISELIAFKNIVAKDSKGSLQQIDNFGYSIPSVKSLNILDLFNDDTKTHNEIFENIKNKDEINDDNWIDITGLYSANEYFEDDKSIPEEIKAKIRELLQSDESKGFIYKKLSELLKNSLAESDELTSEEIALLAVLNKKGLRNMGQSESLAKFIYQVNKLDKNYKFNKTFKEITGEINKFINSHKNDSNELINSFYQISTSLLEKSPAIYRNVVKLLNKLNSQEQELFYKEIFPLYNVELFLGENPEQYEMLGIKVNNNVEGQLIPMHESIKMLLNKLETDKQFDVNSLLLEEKDRLVDNIKQLFMKKFGIKKIPTAFSKENIESIRWHSIYLSNMHELNGEKSAVLGYFLALKLDGKRTEFRTGESIDPSEYMEDSKVDILREYLSKRSERNSISKLQDIEEGDKLVLQESESNTIIGNTNGIVDRLHTIECNIKILLDDDIYSERQKIIKKYIDNNLGKILAKQFQKLSGKNIVFSDEEIKILSDLSNELGDDLTDINNIQKLQNECKPISAIVNFVNKILNENLSNEIQDFEDLCKPSHEHLELLRKIGINLEDGLIISSNSYISYIESGIRKGKDKLSVEEYTSLNEYIIKVNKELGDLYEIKDKLTILYEDFKNKIIDKYFENTVLKQRFELMSPCFFTKKDVEKENIVSFMTNDLDIVIKNIRQCLGCKDKGCNNDTDLSFGCDDRFFITTSHREGDTSFADELVTLLPMSPKEEGFTFVMDKFYGTSLSSDVLLNNIYVIMKKINKLSPELKKQLSIFVPNNIGLSLSEEGIEKIKKQYNGVIIERKDVTVTVEEQPITDSYHEFGGIGCRSTGNANISGCLIKL